MFWGRDLDFQVHRGHKGQIRFPEHNSRSIRAINLKLGTDTHCGWGKIPIHFGVTGVICGVQWSILGTLGHNSKSFRPINLKPGTDSCLGLGNICLFIFGSLGSILGSLEQDDKMSIHFGVNFGVTEC